MIDLEDLHLASKLVPKGECLQACSNHHILTGTAVDRLRQVVFCMSCPGEDGSGGGRTGGGGQGLSPLIEHLAREPTFDAALRDTYHITEGDFEIRWQKDVATRYGWLGWASAVGLVWAMLGLTMVWLVRLRRRRDRARRALLDEGWTVPSEDDPTA